MGQQHKQLAVLPLPEQETAGSYFVANYPPFSVWTQERAGDALHQLDRKGDPDTPLGMYVHIPFCRKRCHFCYFRVYTDKNSSEIRDYLDAVIQEAAMLGRRAFVADRKLHFVYFGGGTPSYLSEKQLTYLMEGLQRAFPWDQAGEIAFECEPGTLSEQKLIALRGLGVTRLSLGIENFDDEVLQLNNRAHKSKEIYQAYEWARAAGFPQINIDLIAGMLGETPENWQRCIEKTIELRPDAVTIYEMEIPYNTTIYKAMRNGDEDLAPLADWPTKRRWVGEAFAALEAQGYAINSAYTAVKDPAKAKFLYRDALWHGADMLGVGVSSFGHLAGVHYQNQAHMEPYVSGVRRGELPVYRAMTMNDEEQMIRQFVLQMKLGRISKRWFLDRFGVDVIERWGAVLKQYEDDGDLMFTADGIELTRRGLLQVDRLLQAFFLPEHREVRHT